jgi:methionyl-tRNA formyltransferase
MKKLRITILVDNPKSWFVEYADRIAEKLREMGHDVVRTADAQEIHEGDVAFFLSCERLIKKPIRDRNTHNIVMHGSKVPQGKGWSPLTRSILEGKKSITVSLFEAEDAVDSGNVYARKTFALEGHELIDEVRKIEAGVMEEMAIEFIESYPPGEGEVQSGEESFYARRKPEDNELDPQKSIVENFNLLRVVDNDRYPAFFKYKGYTYILKIFKKG